MSLRHLLYGLAASIFASPAFAFPVTVDNCGHVLTFDKAPERAIFHDLNMSEMAFALHLQPHMVGVTGISGWYKVTPEFKAEQGSVPELAPKYPTMETLLAANPDFFMAGWYYGMKPGGNITPDTLATKGIRTYVLTESCAQPALFGDLFPQIRVVRLARVVQHAAHHRYRAARLEELAGLVLEELLIVRKVEIHAARLVPRAVGPCRCAPR